MSADKQGLKKSIFKKGPRDGATSQSVSAPAVVLNFKLNSDSSSWFLTWTPALGNMPSSNAAALFITRIAETEVKYLTSTFPKFPTP